MDSTTDIYIYNDKKLITDFEENTIKVGRFILDGILPDRKRVKIRLVLKDNIEKIVLTLINLFYFLHSLSKLVSLGLLNNLEIFHHKKDQMLYDQKIQKIFVFAKCYNISFSLHFFKLGKYVA